MNDSTNSQYHINNSSGTTIVYDGFTTALTAWCNVIPGMTYHIKIAIGDVGDFVHDSAVFLEAHSLNAGIINYSYDNSIFLYPNPAKDNLQIEAPQKSQIEILNIEGQILKTINTAEKQTSIDVSDLSGGVYIIKAKTEKGIAVKKFIKE